VISRTAWDVYGSRPAVTPNSSLRHLAPRRLLLHGLNRRSTIVDLCLCFAMCSVLFLFLPGVLFSSQLLGFVGAFCFVFPLRYALELDFTSALSCPCLQHVLYARKAVCVRFLTFVIKMSMSVILDSICYLLRFRDLFVSVLAVL